MKRITLVCSQWILLLLVCSSCDFYGSTVPISTPEKIASASRLTGKWLLIDDKGPYSYPAVEVQLLPFDELEYVATVLLKERQDSGIMKVETFRVHTSLVDDQLYLNVSKLDKNREGYVFIKLEELREDSARITFIIDSIKTEFQSSFEFKSFLRSAQQARDTSFFSESFIYIRPHALTWDKVNKEAPISSFRRFYSIPRMDEEQFRGLSHEETTALVEHSDTLALPEVKANFEQFYYAKDRGIFKRSRYGVIELNSGQYIKVKYEEGMATLKDFSSEITYLRKPSAKNR